VRIRDCLLLSATALAAVLIFAACGGSEDTSLMVEQVAQGNEPAAFGFTPDGRMLYTERTLGEIRVIDLNKDISTDQGRGALWGGMPVYGTQGGECGMLGIAIDPQFSTNHYVYVYAVEPTDDPSAGRPVVVRFTDVDGRGAQPEVIIDDLPLQTAEICAHVGGNLHFGPDGYLYLAIGNYEMPDTSGDLATPLGKLLRFNAADGSPAPGNPFDERPGADPRVFAYGLRNTFDFAFDPDTGVIYGADNGPGNCDELNIIEAGADYGVPGSLNPDAQSCLGLGGVDPIFAFARPDKRPEEYGSNVAPSGTAFVSKSRYPDLGDGLLVCEFVTGSLRLFSLAADGTVASQRVILDDCAFNVEPDPQGVIYYSTHQGISRIVPDGG
jgi:glucose/arabinose dehydrogenase